LGVAQTERKNRMSNSIKQNTLTALIATYGTSVTRRQLIEFEQAGQGNCSFIGKLYRTGRGQYELPAVYDAGAVASTPSPRAKTAVSSGITLDAPVASANTVVDDAASLSFAVDKSTSAEDILQRIEDLVEQSSALAQVPERNSAFVPFGEFDIIRKIIKSKQFHPVFITGLSGNGKTFQVEQACAIEKVEHIRINITLETDEDDLIGGFRLKNGETVFELGPIPVAMLRGCPITIDEIDLASPKVMCLQPVLEGRPLTIKKLGITIAPKPGFTVFATANTKGRGSDDGRFVGTNLLNEAFLERFPITVEQAYPSINVEKKILLRSYEQLGAKATPEAVTFFETLARWAETIRVTYFEEGIEDLISTRRLVHIVKTYAIFCDEQRALTLCLNRFDKEVQAKFVDLYTKFAPVDEPETPGVEGQTTSEQHDALAATAGVVDKVPF
jgi:MoxR-like ATPase